MLYYLHQFVDVYSPLRIFEYITFRAFGAAGTAFILSLLLGPWVIRQLRRLKVGQQVRREHVEELHDTFHGKKQDTPVMGGILIVTAVGASTLLWAVPTNGLVLVTLATMCFMGAIGFLDDYLKVTRKQSKGLPGRAKLALQTLWILLLFTWLWNSPSTSENVRRLMLPFLKDPIIHDMGMVGSFVFLWLVIVGASNAVNLTDGLDGLAIGCSGSAAVSYLVMAYAAGHVVFADYLRVPYIPAGGELTVFCGALLGGALGFLWFNCHPARVFMGDTGSLALGGAIAMVAVAIKQELVLIIVGAVFVAEALSVLLQVASFRLFGKRIFRMAPIHHHFEMQEKERAEREGRDVEVVETMITTRLWILSIICALLGVATLKIR